MRHLIRFVIVLGCFWVVDPISSADPPKKDVTAAELKLLNGNWHYIGYRVDGVEFPKELLRKVKVTISGQTLRIKPGPVLEIDIVKGKTTYRLEDDFEAKIELDPTAKPKGIDLVFTIEGKTYREKGIYRLEGDRLTVCYSLKKKDRPAEFKSEPGSEDLLLILERDRE